MNEHSHQAGPVELVLGSELGCLDGGVRRLRRIVLDPTTRVVTHLVVGPLHGAGPGRLAPVDLLEPGGRHRRLCCTSAELERLPVAQETAVLLPPDQGSDLLAWPYYGIGGAVGSGWGMDAQVLPPEPVVVPTDLVPPGEADVQPGEQVEAVDGAAGRVRGLTMDRDHRATALLVDLGHRWLPTRAAVPMSSVLAMTDVVTVDLTRAQLRALAGPDAGLAAGPDDVVVGVDDSAAAAAALDVALLEARRSGRSVCAVRAWTTPIWLGGPPGAYPVLVSREATRDTARRLLDASVQDAQVRTSTTDLDVRAVLVEGEPARHLVVLSQDAGLLLVGGRHRGQLVGAALGSVTDVVLHHAQCPVMVVPTPSTAARSVRQVVAGIDGSLASRSALRWAADAARRHGCGLTVAYAWLDPGLCPPEHGSLLTYEPTAFTWLAREVREVLATVLPVGHGVEVRLELLAGAAADGLLSGARAGDLLVLGSRGRGGLASLLLGSVSTRCAQHARGPLVVVREGQERLGVEAPEPSLATRG